MLTNALVAHGIALDTARLKGKNVLLFRRKLTDAIGDIAIDVGMLVGDDLSLMPEGAAIYARYKPCEAVKHMIRMSMTIPWREIAYMSALRDAKEHHEPQAVWELPSASNDGGGTSAFINCHASIRLDSPANLLEVVYHVA